MPNHYRVFLSPQDREQFSSYEPALRKELSDYLLEHARAERLALTSRPAVEFMTDERLSLGEFGIQAQLLATPTKPSRRPRARTRRPRRATSATRWSTRPTGAARQLDPEPAAPSRAGAAGGGRSAPCSAARAW